MTEPLPESSTLSDGQSKITLPAYIEPLSQRIESEDVQYLWRNGAFSIPDIPLRNELLRHYVEFVHPYMPLIDPHDFLQIIDQGNGENGKISLILFQAVMFAGAAFVDRSCLEAAGYAARRAARKSYYQKVKVCYSCQQSTLPADPASFYMILTARVTVLRWSSLSSSLPTGSKHPMIIRIPGTGWALPRLSHSLLVFTEIGPGRLWTSKGSTSKSGYGGHASCEIVSSRSA